MKVFILHWLSSPVTKYCSWNGDFIWRQGHARKQMRLALAEAVASPFVQLVFDVSNTAFMCGWLPQLYIIFLVPLFRDHDDLHVTAFFRKNKLFVP